MIDFASISLLAILCASIAVLLAAAEIGHLFGSRAVGEANVSTLEAAILGLMALMIGFTFSMALSRFDTRRDAVLNEANSIGTAALRARLLPAPYDAESVRLLRDYARIRLDFTGGVIAPGEMDAAIARSNDIQEALWLRAKAVAAKDNAMVPAGIYIQSLNEMFDNQQKRLTAWRNRVPNIVFFALYAIAAVVARLHRLRERTGGEAMAASSLYYEHSGGWRDFIDSRHRPSWRRVYFRQPAADDRYGGQSRGICRQIRQTRALIRRRAERKGACRAFALILRNAFAGPRDILTPARRTGRVGRLAGPRGERNDA